jgi:hypothetical protein
MSISDLSDCGMMFPRILSTLEVMFNNHAQLKPDSAAQCPATSA